MDSKRAGEAPLAEVTDFRTYYLARTRIAASFLFAYFALNVFLAGVYRVWFDLPFAPAYAMLPLEWGLFGPVCLAAAYARWRGGSAVFLETVTLLAVAFVGLAMLVWRYLWHQLGGHFFPGANALFLTVTMATAGVSYRRLFAVAAPILLLEIALSYALYGASPAAHQDAVYHTVAAAVVFVTGWQVHRAVWQTWDEGRYFQQLSERDVLTGLLNLRAFEERARQVLARSAQEHHSVVLAVVDFDHFKHFNDQGGRLAGDRALKSFARLVSRFARQPLDLVARIGDDEFALLWYDVGDEWGNSRAGMLARAASEMSQAQPGWNGSLTASVGAVCGEAAAADLAQLWREADGNLCEAKRRGGNLAVLTAREAAFPAPEPAPAPARRRV